MPSIFNYRRNNGKLLNKAENRRQEYLRFVNEGGLRTVREAIRGCIEFERLTLEKAHNEKVLTVFNHIRQEIASTNVQELLLETKLVMSFLNYNKNGGRLIYPLSFEWIKIFEKSGIKVNRILCFILFRAYLMKHIFIRYLKVIVRRKIVAIRSKQGNSAKVLLYINPELAKAHIEQAKNTELMNFLAWLKKQDFVNHTSHIDFLLDKKISSEVALNIENKIMVFGLSPFVHKMIKLFLENPVHFLSSILVAPNLIFNYCALNEKQLEHVNLLVIPSSMGWIKSTWHLKAEEIGIKVIFVNLSNSGEPSVTFDNKYPVTWAPLSNWGNMTVCSDFQRKYFSEFSKKNGGCNLNLVGVPDWTDMEYDNLINETNFISFFDIEPHVGNYGFSSINDSGYSDISNTIVFIEDITRISAELGIRCILKSKRELSAGKRYKEYEIALSNLSKSNEYFSIVSESVASRRIIGNSMATIHMPFTSTALIGNELGKPTCFYDPVGLISSSDPSAEKIEIIKKPGDLKKWLQNQVGLKLFEHD